MNANQGRFSTKCVGNKIFDFQSIVGFGVTEKGVWNWKYKHEKYLQIDVLESNEPSKATE